MLSSLLLSLWLPSTQDAPAEAPPGLVLVSGGTTRIGSRPEEIEKLVREREELAFSLAGETPQHSAEVESFYLMPNEVTNEQYAEFVRATGSKPPRSWGTKALQAGQTAFLEEQGKAKQEAKAAGKPYETKLFDPELWWEESWQQVEWEIPQAELLLPVVFVTYADAQRYARWAGLRLMTEFEFQCAARGNSARTYPWGDDWDDKKYCQSLHAGRDLAAPVGSFPDGAVKGVHDLAGNVWEWTSSPFTKYPGYEPLRVTTKKRTIECLAPFDPDQRVVVSGSYQMDRIGVRVATRKYADRTQSTSALGFRCAASTTPGLDAAQWIIEQDLRLNALDGKAEFVPSLAATLRRWHFVPGGSTLAGYAVVVDYDHVLACPRAELHAASTASLGEITVKGGPIVVGFIDVSRPTAEPELDAGTYVVAWRGAGDPPQPVAGEQGQRVMSQEPAIARFDEVPGFRADRDCYVLYSPDGVPQVAFEAPPLETGKTRPGSVKVEPFVPPDPKAREQKDPPAPFDTLRFTILVPSAASKAKSFVFDVPILVAPGTYAELSK